MGIVKRQGIYNSAITYTGIIIGFISLLIIQPRFLTKEEIGLTRILFSFSVLVSTFMPLGMNSITLKYFPIFKNDERGHHGFFLLAFLLPIAGFFVLGGMMWLLKDFIIRQYIDQSALFAGYFFYVFPMTFFLALVSVLNAYCYSLFKTSFPSLLNDVIIRLLSIVLFTAYHCKWISLDEFVLLFTLIYGFQMLVLFMYILIVDKPLARLDTLFLKQQNPPQILKYGLLLSFAAISSLGLKYLDVIMLGKFVPLSLVGIYSIAAFIPTVIEAPLFAVEKIGLATISHAWVKKNMDDIQKVYYQSSHYLFLIGGLLFLGINLNIDSLYKLFPEGDFAMGKNVVHIMSIGTLINMATGINDSIIYTSEKYIYGTYMLIILFVLAIVTNFLFIPRFGMEGAALATCLSATIFNMMKLVFIYINFKLQPFSVKTLKTLLTIIIIYVLVSFLPHTESFIADIIYHSVIITALFSLIVIYLGLAPELVDTFKSRLRKRL